MSLKISGSYIAMKVGNGIVLCGLSWNDMTVPPHTISRLPEEHAFMRWLDIRTDYLRETVFLCVLNNPHRDQTHDLSLIKTTELSKNNFGWLHIYMWFDDCCHKVLHQNGTIAMEKAGVLWQLVHPWTFIEIKNNLLPKQKYLNFDHLQQTAIAVGHSFFQPWPTSFMLPAGLLYLIRVVLQHY